MVAFLLLASFFSLIFIGTLFMQQVLGYSALEAGLAWLTVAAPVLLAAATTGAVLVERIGVRPILVVGLSDPDGRALRPVPVGRRLDLRQRPPPGSCCPASGSGCASPRPRSLAAFTGFGESDSGLASGLVNTSQEVGGAVGVAVLAAIAIAVTDDAAGAVRARLTPSPTGSRARFSSAGSSPSPAS